MAKESFNPEREQSRVHEPAELFDKYGYVMFPQQRRIYENLANRLKGRQVLEVGCGNGVGSALLDRTTRQLIATDKLEQNVKFADGLYPWIKFGLWDITRPAPWESKAEVVVAVEVIEHVQDVQAAIRNLLAAADREVWISTPNGTDKPRPPENPYHVREYTPTEMIEMLTGLTDQAVIKVRVLDWENLNRLADPEKTDPLVYHVEFEG